MDNDAQMTAQRLRWLFGKRADLAGRLYVHSGARALWRLWIRLRDAIVIAGRDAVYAPVDFVLSRESRNISRVLARRAVEQTADFVEKHLLDVPVAPNQHVLLKTALRAAEVEGGIYEFGVFKGTSINAIASFVSPRKVYGFDSFEGLPEDWHWMRKEYFKLPGLPAVLPNVVLIKGWFDQTLPGFLKEHREPVSFLHIDCDVYSSTRTVFKALGERIQGGTVIMFDEFFNYPGWKNHEHKAFQEFIASTGKAFDYIGYTNAGQLAVKIVDSPAKT